MKKSEYSSYDGLGIAKLIREKEVNVREVLNTAISIIETYDEDISAITTKAYDHAIKAIEKSQPENIFHGVPFLLKDLNVSCKGLPTTLSSKLFENNIAKNDSYLIKLYKKAGLIILGLTKTPELALSLTTEPKIFGPTKNPLKNQTLLVVHRGVLQPQFVKDMFLSLMPQMEVEVSESLLPFAVFLD